MKAKKNAAQNVGFKEKQPSSRKSIEKKSQKLTERDLENLMGGNRPTYKKAVVELLDINNNGRELLWIEKIKKTMKIKWTS
ncbi:hypothetical protein KUV96_10355 [Bacillus velezensis]|uniref:hypothetical protein n=1 Tax=Bacillus velezensis TaxID=492670 RepID=UPI001C982274|nr:hypothetical protein [Bacillus velezensis]MBY6040622.1 hypothetical protein [Bacillus velezensis]MCA1237413.1 hypothetical protein [Bacillus velezensis]